MTWSLFRWTWSLEAPLFVGTAPAGSLNRCRLYVPARAVWGAVTAELAPRRATGFPDYQGVGNLLQESARFTYLYPAERDGQAWCAWLPRYERRAGLVWRREDRSDDQRDRSDRAMRRRLLGTRPATAIDPSSDTAAEGSLRETECVNTHWRDGDGAAGSPVALVAYVFSQNAAPELGAVDVIAIGGDTRYGLGRLRRIEWTEASAVFGNAARLDGAEPSVESDRLLAHADVAAAQAGGLRGQREALGGWDYGKRGVQRIAGALWMPGSLLDYPRPWIVEAGGLWRTSPSRGLRT